MEPGLHAGDAALALLLAGRSPLLAGLLLRRGPLVEEPRVEERPKARRRLPNHDSLGG